MNCIRVGVDMVDVERIARLLTEQADLIPEMFTPREQAYCQGQRTQAARYAARFAAKEAVLKAFGTGLGPAMCWTDVEITHHASGKPQVSLHGEVARQAQRGGLMDIDVSLTHTASHAIAYAVLIWQKDPLYLSKAAHVPTERTHSRR